MAWKKPVRFWGSARDDLRAFPSDARKDAGYQIDKVQAARAPDDWRPMKTVGKGAFEIRIHEESGAFRVIYVARFADAIHVLHCFRKTQKKTSKADIEKAAKRYRELMKERGDE